MRIGFLIYGDINTISGGYLYDRKLIECFRNAGDEVTIISLDSKGFFQDVISNQSPTSIDVSDFDILVEDELIHPSMYKTNTYVRKQVPIVALVHLFHSYSIQPQYINWLYRRIEKKYLATVDGLILNSKSTARQAEQLLEGKQLKSMIALPAGDNFSATEISKKLNSNIKTEQPVRLLYIGNVIKQKGLHVLLNALSRLDPGSFKLMVTGRTDMEPDYVNKIYNLINKYNLSEHVNFTGPLPHASLPGIYRDNHAMVLPSHNEAFGIVYLEAMQFGLPVIGTTSGGACEIISHNDNGFLITPGDDEALAGYIRNWIDDPDSLERMGNNAVGRFQRHPDWEQTGLKVRDFLLSYL